ncbi:MAG: spore cortex biosynthesis protein YabQ [Candidatus Spyradocola sp.]
MLFETLGQARVFLLMAAVGAVISLLYDVLCLVKGAFGRHGGWISEAMFACAAAVLLFLGMARVQAPTLRPYVLLGTAVGWFLYAVSISRFLHWAGEKIGKIWKKGAKSKG